ncbi:hypothetical protein B4119_4110 [Parageobacillus caldoxylosilyticus]|uniref:Uncharacterized protein n=1 Tax=Saccharococcus caldoxylosilyticus TaxID=81408 RepID=A0A150LUX4_9BACL|nr:hypothetical protein B4119_4110 [Parageobacillus caldoxylosilyticus]
MLIEATGCSHIDIARTTPIISIYTGDVALRIMYDTDEERG